MYGKLFAQMYDGTLGTVGPWQALVTFQQLIILADKEGVVDMTPEAISRRTTIPLDVVQVGLEKLTEPDPHSRTPDEEGRRIVLLDEHRPWGWRIVNHGHYRKIRSHEERKEYMRKYMADKRLKEKSVNYNVSMLAADNPKLPIAVSSKQYAVSNKTLMSSKLDDARQILQFLNQKTGRRFPPVDSNLKLIVARLNEGHSADDCRMVIARKWREWRGDEKMVEYARPKTLFNATNFNNYIGECVIVKENSDGSMS